MRPRKPFEIDDIVRAVQVLAAEKPEGEEVREIEVAAQFDASRTIVRNRIKRAYPGMGWEAFRNMMLGGPTVHCRCCQHYEESV